jgi:hypothetical protein
VRERPPTADGGPIDGRMDGRMAVACRGAVEEASQRREDRRVAHEQSWSFLRCDVTGQLNEGCECIHAIAAHN